MRVLVLGLVSLLSCAPAYAEEVDLELVLLGDASGSIDDAEIRFEREGWARALADPAVQQAIGGGFYGKIALTYVEWGQASSQDVVVPWTIVGSPDAAASFGAALLEAPRRAFGRNAIGSALAKAHELLDSNPETGARRVIDFAGDSAWSWGGVPVEEARQAALADGITINGLAHACREEGCSGRPGGGYDDVESAFEQRIIGGPASFVLTAESRERFAEAARQKLIQEIAGPTPTRAVAAKAPQ